MDLRIAYVRQTDDHVYWFVDALDQIKLMPEQRCQYENALQNPCPKLLILERAIIRGRRQPKAVLDETFLSAPVPAVHGL